MSNNNRIARILSIPVTFLIILLVFFLDIPNPMVPLLVPVMLFTYLDGYIGGILSGCLSWAYAFCYLCIFTQDGAAASRLITSGIAVAAVIILLGGLKAVSKRTVTQLKQTQARLVEEEKRVKLMLDSTPLACTIRDNTLKVCDCNEEAVRLFRAESKSEFVENHVKFSPEYQPNGRLSSEYAAECVKKAYEEGRYVFEWTHRTKDGELFPAEITIIRAGLESGEYTTVGYTRDLREQKRMIAEIEKRGSLLDTINQAAGILLHSNIRSFNSDIVRCMGMIGTAVGTDRVSIWRNYTTNGQLRCSQIFEWRSDAEMAVNNGLLTDVLGEEKMPVWIETLSRGECVSSLVNDMTPVEKEQLKPSGILSIFVVPVFVEGKFWGFVGFDNCREERLFNETEQPILRSGGLLLVNSFVRQQMNLNVRESAALLQTMVKNYMGIVWYVDDNGIISLIDGLMTAKIGIVSENIVGKRIGELPQGLLHPDIIDCTRKAFTEGAQEFILKTEKGAFHIRTSPVYGKDGNMTGVVGNSDEITEILHLQDELKEALDNANKANAVKDVAVNSLESIMNSIDAMIYVSVPETGELLFVNDYMKNFFNKKDAELVGKQCYKIFRNIDHKCESCPCYRLAEEPYAKLIWDSFEPLVEKHIRHSDCLIDWPDGRRVHLQHAVDITELVSAREAAEQSNRSKGVFIAQMSHEVRTPMNAILGISEIQLRNERLSSDAEEGFKQIYDSGNLLLNIINDILDFSKIDAGKMEIVPNKYDIPSLINNTMQLCRLRYESKPIAFNVSVDGDTPLELIGDELRIRQILNNLLSNAFKYTDAGEVQLSVASEQGQNGDAVTLVLVVSDTGQGMSGEQIGKLFDEYLRFNMEKNHGIPGTGLGMNITRRLIEMMNGNILVESKVGEGTTFTVRLPQKSCGSVKCGTEISESLRNFNFVDDSISKRSQIVHEYMPYGRVLIVDDVESNLYVAKGLLLPYGLYIETVKSGMEAIERIKNGNVYDIVFMDHMMPVMDGIKATGILRESGYDKPIVALTANAISGQSEMFLQNGFDKFISKPIDSRELDLVLIELIRDKKPAETVEAARRERHKAVIAPKKDLSELEKYFVMDAGDAVKVLENIYARIDSLAEADIQLYTVTAHGIKSALKNIGETKLSELALKLEKASDMRDMATVAEETPLLIEKVKALITKLKPKETDNAVRTSDGDTVFLKEKLSEIKTACAEFNIRAAETALSELKGKSWPQEIDAAVNEISVCLLCGEFERVVGVVDGVLG